VAGILRNYIGICFLAAAIVPALAFASPGEPDMPPGKDPGGVAVAIIDSGINYTLGFVAPRLARDAKGQILGYDFQDNDRLPFDLVPGQKPDSGRHHGTRVAGIFLREAPKARLIPYRYRAHSFGTFARIVETIAASPARIVIMSLGGYRKNDWAHFETAARANPKLLFIISAGNDGRNIDEKPVYPSSYKLDNALVVASTDNFGRLPPSSNWGTKTVDISTPGEEIETIDHAGTKTFVSGSSFAVPRIAALAARLLQGQRLVSKSGALWRWDGFTADSGAVTSAATEPSRAMPSAASSAAMAPAASAGPDSPAITCRASPTGSKTGIRSPNPASISALGGVSQ
jgi:hypothetical protein